MSHCRTVLFSFLFLLGAVSTSLPAQSTTTGFSESFALAKDRAKIVEELIPGTQDYYFYTCLERQHVGDWMAVTETLKTWIHRHGRSAAVEEIENRQALLTYSNDPAATFVFLRKRLGLKYDHQPEHQSPEQKLPTALDPELLSLDAWTKRALARHPRTLRGITQRGLASLATSGLDDSQLRSFLNRIDLPDIPNLPQLVVRELNLRSSTGFGRLAAHRTLTLAQLDECARLRPELLKSQTFVSFYARRLQPGADEDWRDDPIVREAYLDRLATFAARLGEAQNSFKAHVLHHRLRHDLAIGKPDKSRFLAYLRLPKRSEYANDDFLKRPINRENMVNLGSRYGSDLGRANNDNELVRRYFEHYFKTEDNYEAYSEFVSELYLRRVLAETKILAGKGDMERWYSMLNSPSYFESLKERVEIRLLESNEHFHALNDVVSIAAEIKNVKTLLVKVYEINTINYYNDQKKEVDASLQIDGLVASEEFTFEYTEAPLRRVARTFNFPSLKGAGVWLIDFIGNGLSSRAVVRKGQLDFTERLGIGGHVMRVLNDDGELLKDAAIIFGQKRYDADEDGDIYIPYSTRPGKKAITLVHKDRATLAHFQHMVESYSFEAPIFVKRESLVAGNVAELVIRPSLTVNKIHAPLSLIQNPSLEIRSVDLHGVTSSMTIRDIKLVEGQELVHEIHVPENMRILNAQLKGKIRVLSTDKDVNLRGKQEQFRVNRIDTTRETASPLLTRTPSGYEIHLLGKNGEPIANRAVTVILGHPFFKDSYEPQLRTDAKGVIKLGALEGVHALTTKSMKPYAARWNLTEGETEFPSRINAGAAQVIRLPYLGSNSTPQRSEFSLFELKGGAPAVDRFESVALAGGFLELRGLAAGDYRLQLKKHDHLIRISVSAAPARDGLARGRSRALEIKDRYPLAVATPAVEGDDLIIRCTNISADTRLHVFATRYLPAHHPWNRMRVSQGFNADEFGIVRPETSYHSGRVIGDEFRYVLERRFVKKFPGNMLDRPELLLNPWAFDSADDSIGIGGGAGGRHGGRKRARRGRGRAGPGSFNGQALDPASIANLDFMDSSTPLLNNLRPKKDGTVKIPLSAFGENHIIHVVALDGKETTYRTMVRPLQKLTVRDRRLARSLDTSKHFAQQQTIQMVNSGEEALVLNLDTSAAEHFDTLGSVFELFQTLSGNNDLRRFSFLLKWPGFDDKKKKEVYSAHACHELNFFLFQKDPDFFLRVVQPYIANKSEKTFLDQWLLKEDLTSYIEPYAFSRLNIVEKILLLRRVDETSSGAARYIQDMFEMVPHQPATLAHLFESTLKSNSLSKSEYQGGFAPTGGGRGGAFPSRKPAKRAEITEKSKAIEEDHLDAPLEDIDAEEVELEPQLNLNAAQDRAAEMDKSRYKAGEDRKLKAFANKDLNFRARKQTFFRPPEETRRYVEHNYWHRTVHNTTSKMIAVNGFWRDFAGHATNRPFISSNFHQATTSFAEMMFALSVLDLPFKAAEHVVKEADGGTTLQAKSPLILVHQEIREAKDRDAASPILISQAYFRADDPHYYVGREKRDKYISDEFLRGVVYGCRIVVTNPTSSSRDLKLLVQVPAGAILVENGRTLESVPLRLDGYRTSTKVYFFYFPSEGSFDHYPVQATSEGLVVATAEKKSLNVVEKLSKKDTTSWQYISQNATNKEVLQYVENANLRRTPLQKIAWRMKDKSFFEKTLATLRKRHGFSRTLWSYALLHEDARAAREYLETNSSFVSRCGPYLDSPLLTLDAVDRKVYQHIEYSPLINARAHQFGSERHIANQSFKGHFTAFMNTLAYKSRLSAMDWMAVTYYFLLQDRIEEALDSFDKINAKKINSQLQYDYMMAYLDFFENEQKMARTIALRHKDHPVDRWRGKFRDMLAQLDEIEGVKTGNESKDNESKTDIDVTSAEPSLDLEVDSRMVSLTHTNLEECEIAFYEMDIEFLFSANPFVRDGSNTFAYVKPNFTRTLSLNHKLGGTDWELPARYRNSNLMIEVRAKGIVKRQTCFANSIVVSMKERFGQLKVTHAGSGKAMPKVYVKVFARERGGKIRFHKDGYTDLRGRFDYASLSGSEGRNAKEFSILVLSEKDGAMIKEAKAPVE